MEYLEVAQVYYIYANMKKRNILMLGICILLSLIIIVIAEDSLTSYEYIYENLSWEKPIYKYNLTEVKPVYNSINGTWSKGYNYTSSREIIGYKTVYYNGDRIGLKVGDKTINHPNVNIKDDKVIEWAYPIGDRNFKEFGTCREYEKQKGMCKETSILELTK